MSFSPASRHLLVTVAATATALGAPAAVLAQDSDLEEIVVTGTRKGGQSPTETLSPVDLLSGSLLSEQATFDLTDALPKVSPSLNTQRFPIADGTAFIRPLRCATSRLTTRWC
jgi:iron complex outermembrane receptor protein